MKSEGRPFASRLVTFHSSLFTFRFSLFYAEDVAIKLCPRCRKPFLAAKEICPHCPEPYTWNQESYANVGCLMAMLLPLIGLIMFWIFMFLGPFFR